MTSYQLQRLVCKNCDITADMRLDPDDKTHWPLHKCKASRTAEPFSTVIGVPKPPVRDLSEYEPPKPIKVKRDLSYLKVIG